jgi:hypothetical protein
MLGYPPQRMMREKADRPSSLCKLQRCMAGIPDQRQAMSGMAGI